MTSTDRVTLGKRANTREVSASAVAMLDERGTVVAWTQAAEHLLGYSAGDVVGRSGALVLPSSEETPTISAFIEQCRAQSDWSGTITVRHRDGRMLGINHRISMLWGQDGTFRWLVSVTDIGTLSREARNGSVRESLLTHAPIGIVVRDQQLRCVWVNDTMERHDAISRDRRFGRRLVSSMPGSEAEALEAVMRRALRNGTTAVHEYRAWPTKDSRQEHAFSASYGSAVTAPSAVVRRSPPAGRGTRACSEPPSRGDGPSGRKAARSDDPSHGSGAPVRDRRGSVSGAAGPTLIP
ncbi:PAS domain-containing protein [Streptomyces mirabilis]|uniref:PAS domain-containing protein n=1 Tax=Streptomyces mirabilis TaxID=68239 RepID=UPI0036B1E21F